MTRQDQDNAKMNLPKGDKDKQRRGPQQPILTGGAQRQRQDQTEFWWGRGGRFRTILDLSTPAKHRLLNERKR